MLNFQKLEVRLAAGTIAGQASFFLASPLLTEKYGAAGFGVFALSYAIVSIGGSLAALKMESLIVVQKETVVAEQLVSASLLCSTFITIFCYILWKLVIVELIEAASTSMMVELMVVMSTIMQGWIGILTSLATRNNLFNHLAMNRFMPFGMITITGLFFPPNVELNGLMVGIFVSGFVQLVVFLVPLYRQLFGISFRTWSAETKKEIRSAVRWMFPATATDVISQHLPLLIVSTFFGAAITGMFVLAMRLLYAPLSSIGGAFSTVFFQKFSVASEDQRKELILQAWKILSLFGLLGYTPILLFGPEIFITVYGPEWKLAGDFSRIIAIIVFFNMVFSPTSVGFIVIGLRQIPLVAAGSAFFYRLGAFSLGVVFESVMVALYIFCICEVTQILITNRYLWRHLR